MLPAHVSMQSHKVSDFEILLFRLPAELRLEIYYHALSLPRTTLNLLSDDREIQWLTTSSAIFLEAAPLIYREPPLHFDVDLGSHTRGQSIHMAFYSHAETTFLFDRKWAFTLLCEMAEKIVIDVPVSHDCREVDRLICDCTPGRWHRTSSRDPRGHLSGPECLVNRRMPLMPAVENVALRIHWPYPLSREQSSSIEEAWQGEDVSEEVCTRLLGVAPFLHDVVSITESINCTLREKMPALRGVVWHLQHDVGSPPREARHAMSAERFMELFIKYFGDKL